MKSFKLVGQGPRKVLLFPGLLGTRDAFDDMLRYADLDAFQYAIVEYRGYGHSKNEPGLFTLREVVIDAVRLVEFLGWNRLAVAGHSLGALAAQMLAVALPHRVDAIVSIAGLSAKGASADPQRQRFMQELAHSRERREALVHGATGNRYADGFARALVAVTWDNIDGDALTSYAIDASRTDIHAQVESLETPVLVLVGECDPNCSAAAARETMLRWCRLATLQVLPGVGHFPMVEAPAQTLSALEHYVAAGHAGTSDQAVSEAAIPA
ncbi:alpha/beta hydrolase [Paraburkholderia sp. CNPSo 3272]|uniref:alpha/beta fold hydrolase n=1 Tax=Paraburkholderia sp. CNPSo 3272 TaxID=2940931 RepID=UPI0020B74493|nr:alpha/beta hydrolase [Paraburkholderia sp. CNPSo 3272]MCP3728076.1 alpha/beta hydrolase [Paraburkholderia sp. CNPSo 3272]